MKTKAGKRTRFTRHARVKRSSSVRKTISRLGRTWDFLDPATRGEELRELIAIGCTRRGLAEDLRVSPTNIRFHLGLAELSPTEKTAVKCGASAKRAFVTLQARRQTHARIERIRVERMTSAVSDRLAKDIALFCIEPHRWGPDKDLVVLCEGDIELFFVELDRALEMHLRGFAPMPLPAAPHVDFKAVCLKLKPPHEDSVLWFSWLAEWLALALLSAAPDAIIRDAARRKAPGVLSAMLRQQSRVV